MEPLRTSALDLLTPLELRSLKLNLCSKKPLNHVLGIAELPGSSGFVDIARRMASDCGDTNTDPNRYLVAAVALLSHRIECPQFKERLFKALSTGRFGGESFVSFKTLRSWLYVVMSGFDFDPLDFGANVRPLNENIVERVLAEFKVPAVRLESFHKLLHKYPFLLAGQQRIWQRMLVDQQSVESSKRTKNDPPFFKEINRDDGAVVVALMGPLPRAQLLFRTHVHGFSMRALEENTKFWEDDAGILFVIACDEFRVYLRVCEAGCVLLECAPQVHVVQEVDVQVKYDQGIIADSVRVAQDLRYGVFWGQSVNIEDLAVYGLRS